MCANHRGGRGKGGRGKGKGRFIANYILLIILRKTYLWLWQCDEVGWNWSWKIEEQAKWEEYIEFFLN